MTEEEAIKRLDDADKSGDQEIAHIEADQVLCDLLRELGYKNVVDRYKKIGKWYA